MMGWDPRFYATVLCFAMLGRWTYRAGMREASDEIMGWGGFLMFWLPIAVLIGIAISFLIPVVGERWARYRRRRSG